MATPVITTLRTKSGRRYAVRYRLGGRTYPIVDGGSPEVGGLPDWLMPEVAVVRPREDRTTDRPVFAGFTPDVAKNVMARACKTAGIIHRHPHDHRHRYASVKIAEGVPVTQVAAQLGHSRKSLTLDTYSHVLVDDWGHS